LLVGIKTRSHRINHSHFSSPNDRGVESSSKFKLGGYGPGQCIVGKKYGPLKSLKRVLESKVGTIAKSRILLNGEVFYLGKLLFELIDPFLFTAIVY
jgi:hypothetical protein